MDDNLYLEKSKAKHNKLSLYIILITVVILWGFLTPKFWPDLSQKYFFMPILGVLAATVANTTPVAAGLVYFPILTYLKISPLEAVLYTMMIQSYGMGIGAIRWFIEDRRLFLWKVLPICLLFGAAGAFSSIMIFPLDNPGVLKNAFNIISFILVSAIFYSVIKKHRYPKTSVALTKKNIILLIISAYVGGVFTGWLGFGVDTVFYFLLTLVFRVQPAIAIVTSIALMTGMSIFGTGLHYILHPDVLPWGIWYSALPGVTLGGIFLAAYLTTEVTMKKFFLIFIFFLIAEFGVISITQITLTVRYIIQFVIINALVLYLVYIHIRLFRQSYVDFWIAAETGTIDNEANTAK